jgi:serine/threonine-protein kinase ATR
MSVVNSQKPERERRGRQVLERIKVGRNSVCRTLTHFVKAAGMGGVAATLADQCVAMTSDLLGLCELPIKEGDQQLTVSTHIPRLHKLAPSRLIVPLQESLVVTLPPSSALRVSHQPFPHQAPTIKGKCLHLADTCYSFVTF